MIHITVVTEESNSNSNIKLRPDSTLYETIKGGMNILKQMAAFSALDDEKWLLKAEIEAWKEMKSFEKE